MARPNDTDWKDQRKEALGENHIISIRLSEPVHTELHKLAKKHNTTVAAIARHSLGKFLTDQRPAPAAAKSSLFE